MRYVCGDEQKGTRLAAARPLAESRRFNHDSDNGWVMSEDLADGASSDVNDDYSEQEDRLAVYEYIGMLTASLGFFVPLLTLPAAGYCAYRIRNWKPVTALLLAALALTTIVFWVLVVVFIIQPPFVSGTPESQTAAPLGF
jgi:hypothetical protein